MTESTTLASASRDGYPEATSTARDYMCGDCGGRLVVKWQGDRYHAVCGRYPEEHQHIRPYAEAERDGIRARLEADPRTAQALAVSGASVPQGLVPLTTQVLRNLTQEQLQSRMAVRYGDVQDPAVRGQILALAKTYALDPVFDLMVYEGRPYVTYEGRLRKLREAPGYRGHKVRPLSRQEKEVWDWKPEDIVVEASADMGMHGEIIEYGVVTRAEIDRALRSDRKPPPVGTHPQLIAIKRAVGRLSRMAVGIDLPTIDTIGGQIIEVTPVQRGGTNGALPAPADSEAEARKRFWATARNAPPDGMGLNEDQVHRLLEVESLKDYPGGWAQALSDLYQRRFQEDLEPDDAPPASTDSTSAEPGSPPSQATAVTAPPSEPPVSPAAADPVTPRLTTAECLLCHTVQVCTENPDWNQALVCVDDQACAERQRRSQGKGALTDPAADAETIGQWLIDLGQQVTQHDLALVPANKAGIKAARVAMQQAAGGDVELAEQLLEAMTGKRRPEDLTQGQADVILEAADRPGWFAQIAALRRVRGI